MGSSGVIPRYPRGYRDVFLRHNGDGPWPCDECHELVHEFGRHADQGHIHHRDEDKHNSAPDNLGIMHCACHRRQHMLGSKASDEHREAIRRGLVGHKVTDETRQKISNANRGRGWTLVPVRHCPYCSFSAKAGPLAMHIKHRHGDHG